MRKFVLGLLFFIICQACAAKTEHISADVLTLNKNNQLDVVFNLNDPNKTHEIYISDNARYRAIVELSVLDVQTQKTRPIAISSDFFGTASFRRSSNEQVIAIEINSRQKDHPTNSILADVFLIKKSESDKLYQFGIDSLNLPKICEKETCLVTFRIAKFDFDV